MDDIKTGDKFGELTVLSGRRYERYTYYEVQCICGNIKYAVKANLLRKNKKASNRCKSCPITLEQTALKVGTKFGSWTIIPGTITKIGITTKKKMRLFKAQCKCGVIKHLPKRRLESRRTTQCFACRTESRKRLPKQ